MEIEDYTPTLVITKYKMGSSSKIVGKGSIFLHNLKPEDFVHTDQDTYLKGFLKLDGFKVLSFRTYAGNKGSMIGLVSHGEFDKYDFWNYEDINDPGVQKLKSLFPGSGHVQLVGQQKRTQEKLQELIDNLIEYSDVLRHRKFKKSGKR